MCRSDLAGENKYSVMERIRLGGLEDQADTQKESGVEDMQCCLEGETEGEHTSQSSMDQEGIQGEKSEGFDSSSERGESDDD